MQVGPSTLAAATGDAVVRVWDFEQDENYILNVTVNGVVIHNFGFTAVSYDPATGLLAAGKQEHITAVDDNGGLRC